jgi:hypothetical protein
LKYSLPEEQLARAKELVQAGIGCGKFAEKFGLSMAIARRIVSELRVKLGVQPNAKFQRSDAKQVAEADLSMVYERAIREAAKLRLSQDRRIRWSPSAKTKPVGIAVLADVHAGCDGVDYDAMDRDIDLILNTPGLYCIVGGDVIDNHIRHMAAVIAAGMSPANQWQWLARILAKLGPKIIAIVGGNHEAWTVAVSGYDPLKPLADKLTTPYREHEAIVDVSLAKVSYTICVRHKYRFNSTMNPGHSVKRLWEFGPVDWDVGVLCHNHEAVVEPFTRHGRRRWGMRPGTYQILSGYADAQGYHNAMPITPAVILMPNQRALHAFDGVDWAAKMLGGASGRN